ncbi:hypothetical protein PCAR4_440078 [Paraburkholderia caribensis]|nr:hypothetical protein PCAR4_440078 [Paraburkholderia caribensis]
MCLKPHAVAIQTWRFALSGAKIGSMPQSIRFVALARLDSHRREPHMGAPHASHAEYPNRNQMGECLCRQ